MRRPLAVLAIVLALAGTARAQETAKIGIIAPFSGPFAVYGQHFQRGAELYLEQIGSKAGATRIELLYRDESGGPERGYDGGKQGQGRQRHSLVDTLGFLIAVLMTSAGLDEGNAAPQLLALLSATAFPRAMAARSSGCAARQARSVSRPMDRASAISALVAPRAARASASVLGLSSSNACPP